MNACLGEPSGIAHQRRVVDRHRDRSCRVHPLAVFDVVDVVGVAGLVVRLVVDGVIIGAGGEGARKPGKGEPAVVAVAGEVKQPPPTRVVLRVADEVMVEVGIPCLVEAEAALCGRPGDRAPAGMVLGDQERVRPNGTSASSSEPASCTRKPVE